MEPASCVLHIIIYAGLSEVSLINVNYIKTVTLYIYIYVYNFL